MSSPFADKSVMWLSSTKEESAQLVNNEGIGMISDLRKKQC
jgi:hypothetical protein